MTPPKQQQDKDFLLRTAQALAILGPREAGGAGFITRDEGRRYLNEKHEFGVATEADTVPAPRHPDFQGFLSGLTPEEITELEIAVLQERHAIEEWRPAMTSVPVPDGGLGELDDPPNEE